MKHIFANRKLILIAGGLLAIFGVGYALMPSTLPKPFYIQFSVGPTVQEPAVAATLSPEPPTVTFTPGSGIMYELKDRVVNLADPGGYRYLRVAIVLELLPSSDYLLLQGEERQKARKEFLKEFSRRSPMIEDTVTMILSSKTFGEIYTMAGKQQLKAELQQALNSLLGQDLVRQVYFTDFVVQ